MSWFRKKKKTENSNRRSDDASSYEPKSPTNSTNLRALFDAEAEGAIPSAKLDDVSKSPLGVYLQGQNELLSREEFKKTIRLIETWINEEQYHRKGFPKETFLKLLAQVDPDGHMEREARLKRRRQSKLDGPDPEQLKFERSQKVKEERLQREEQERQRRLRAIEQANLRAEALDAAERLKAEEAERKRQAYLAQCRQYAAELETGLEYIRRRRSNQLERLEDAFRVNFLSVRQRALRLCVPEFSYSEIEHLAQGVVKKWFREQKQRLPAAYKHLPDDEQIKAIAAGEENLLLVARAGSGKTGTIVNRVDFLIQFCGVEPNDILVLAFNKKAALELRERVLKRLDAKASGLLQSMQDRSKGKQRDDPLGQLRDRINKVCRDLNCQLPHIMTFHALAYRLTHPDEEIVFDDLDGYNDTLSQIVQSVIDDFIRDDMHFDQVRRVMLAHFRTDWDRIVEGGYYKNREELLEHRRMLPRESLRGEPVKSRAEKIIADFFLEHGVSYSYESRINWNGSRYCPDFRIRREGAPDVILEYFGLQGDDDYDEQSDGKRLYWKHHEHFEFFELSPQDWADGAADTLRYVLQNKLVEFGVELRKLSEDEIWALVAQRARDRFTGTVKNFISRSRSLQLVPDDIEARAHSASIEDASLQDFWKLAALLYSGYLDRLVQTGAIDFQGLLLRSISNTRLGETRFRNAVEGEGDLSRLRFVFIDEFQDFNPLFHQMTDAIREQNSRAVFFCVGDDWQSINAFAGANLEAFENFKTHFGPDALQLFLTRNYRSAPEIVGIGNAIMPQSGEPGKPVLDRRGKTLIGRFDELTMSPAEAEALERDDEMSAAILRLAGKALRRGKDVLLLSRQRMLNTATGYVSLDKYVRTLKKHLPMDFRDKLAGSTTHSAKGLEADVTIILDAEERSYPLVHPAWVFTSILGDSIKKIVSDERRLFYVATTRAKSEVYFLARDKRISRFLQDANLQVRSLRTLSWSDFPPLQLESQFVVVSIGNARSGATIKIKELLKASNYKYSNQPEPHWRKVIPFSDFNLERVKQEIWCSKASGIEVRIGAEWNTYNQRFLVDFGEWQPVSSTL